MWFLLQINYLGGIMQAVILDYHNTSVNYGLVTEVQIA